MKPNDSDGFSVVGGSGIHHNGETQGVASPGSSRAVLLLDQEHLTNAISRGLPPTTEVPAVATSNDLKEPP